MKFYRFLATAVVVASLGVVLGGCPATVGTLLTPVTNPVNSVDIYRVKNTYAATLQLAADWRTYCYSKAYADVLQDPVMKPVCESRRGTVRQIQKYQPLAGTAVRKADDFVKNNPTLSAVSVIGPAWDAVTAFQAVVPKVN